MALRVIKQGSKGAAVKRWQFFLVGEKFDVGAVDGIFGKKTHIATRAFQKKHRLTVDGVVGNGSYGKAMQLGFEGVSDPDDDLGAAFPGKPGFKPLVGNAARAKVFGKFSFRHSPISSNRERIIITDNWEDDNIVTLIIPQLIGVKGANSKGKVRFHKKGAKQLVALWDAWEKAGLLKLVISYEGSFVPRFIRGSRKTLSNHAFGSAFDINFAFNGLGKLPALKGRKGSVRELVPLAHKHGFYWGGHFTRRDGMHFEVAKVK